MVERVRFFFDPAVLILINITKLIDDDLSSYTIKTYNSYVCLCTVSNTWIILTISFMSKLKKDMICHYATYIFLSF